MTVQGTIVNGTEVLDQPVGLPDGTRVAVDVTELPAASSLGAVLLRHAGKAVGLPDDLAAQHDHYLHGTPKRRAAVGIRLH